MDHPADVTTPIPELATPIGVFLLDDHEMVRRGIADLLEEEPGITVVGEAATAAEAVRRIPAAQPQVALLDARLPDGSGIDLCANVRSHSDLLSTYLILLTARDRPEDLVAGLQAGANDYVKKPFDASELKARIAIGARVIELQERVQALSGLLPICSWCKKIRDDKAEWVSVERYVSQHSQVQFTHGGCPDCIEKVKSARMPGR